MRLLITLQIMQHIKSPLSQQLHSYRNMAACCLVFFGFLRVSEFTVPCHNHYDQSSYLSLQHISIDNRVNPRSNQQPCMPCVGRTPILALRGTQAGPLLITEHSEGLTWQIFSSVLDSDHSSAKPHSL